MYQNLQQRLATVLRTNTSIASSEGGILQFYMGMGTHLYYYRYHLNLTLLAGYKIVVIDSTYNTTEQSRELRRFLADAYRRILIIKDRISEIDGSLGRVAVVYTKNLSEEGDDK